MAIPPSTVSHSGEEEEEAAGDEDVDVEARVTAWQWLSARHEGPTGDSLVDIIHMAGISQYAE